MRGITSTRTEPNTIKTHPKYIHTLAVRYKKKIDKMKPLKTNFFILTFLLLSFSCFGQKYYEIPLQKIDLLQYMGKENPKFYIDTLDRFSLSEFITYGQYKQYLTELQKDSSIEYYISQRPDSNIAPSAEVYSEYVNSTLFDNEPVVGISWDNAMNYCIWKTLKDNKSNKIKFIYRLPSTREWLAALYYLEQKKLHHDLNDKFADWLIDAYYSNFFEYWGEFDGISFLTDFYVPFEERNDTPSAWKRKLTAGNSYLFSEPTPLFYRFWFFQYDGQRHLGFRLVKEYVKSENPKLPINKFINQCILKND